MSADIVENICRFISLSHALTLGGQAIVKLYGVAPEGAEVGLRADLKALGFDPISLHPVHVRPFVTAVHR